jgi:hypothetical protein
MKKIGPGFVEPSIQKTLISSAEICRKHLTRKIKIVRK